LEQDFAAAIEQAFKQHVPGFDYDKMVSVLCSQLLPFLQEIVRHCVLFSGCFGAPAKLTYAMIPTKFGCNPDHQLQSGIAAVSVMKFETTLQAYSSFDR